MQLKKIALVFLVVIMMFSLAAMGIAAEGAGSELVVSATVKSDNALSEDPLAVKPGDIIEFVITVDSNPGNIEYIDVEVEYDIDALKYESFELGNIFEQDTTATTPLITQPANANGKITCWLFATSETYAPDQSKTGVFITLTFKVLESFDGDIEKLDVSNTFYSLFGNGSGVLPAIDVPSVKAHNYGTPELLPGDCVTATKHVYTCECEGCDDVLVVDYIAPAGHQTTDVPVAKVPADCVNTGFDEHFQCSVCQKYFKVALDENGEQIPGDEVSYDDLVIPSNNGHLFTFVSENPATCDNTGKEAHYVCERESCGQLAQKLEGSEEYVDVNAEDLVISALGHAYKSVDLVPAFCEKEGKAAHFICERCPELFVEVEGEKVVTTVEELVIPALEHILGDIVEYVAPSAAEFGFEAHYLCTRGCGQYFNADGEKSTYNDLLIDKLPPEITNADDSWVKGDSNSKVEFKSDGHIDDFKDFWFNGSKLEKDKDYTVREGSIIVTLTDSFLATIEPGKTYDIGIESVSGIATTTFEVTHDYGEIIQRVEPNCVENGHVAYYYCGATCCNTYFDANKNVVAENVTEIPAELVLKALGHKPAGAMIEKKAPTCTDIGYTVDCYKCRVCGGYYNMSATGEFYDLSADAVEIPALGHNGVIKVDAKAPTCDDAGNVEHFICERCGKTVNADNEVIEVVLSPLGHNGVTKVDAKAPTCDDAGNVEHFICERCGKTVNADNKVIDAVIPANGHSYGELQIQIDATCETAGTEAHYVCSVCGQLAQKAEGAEDYTKVTADDLVIPAAGHKYGEEIPQVDATCETAGTEAHYVCSVCGQLAQKAEGAEDYTKVTADDLVIPAAGHMYGEEIPQVDATRESAGTEAHYVCSVCGQLAQKAVGAEDYTKVTADDLVIPKLPKMISVPEESVWTKGGDNSLGFVSDAKFEEFVSVKLNDALLGESDYKLEKTEDGNIKVILEPAMLDKLEEGDYTITIASANGTCDAGFTVENSSAVLTIVIVIIAVVVIVAGAAASIFVLKKKKII